MSLVRRIDTYFCDEPVADAKCHFTRYLSISAFWPISFCAFFFLSLRHFVSCRSITFLHVYSPCSTTNRQICDVIARAEISLDTSEENANGLGDVCRTFLRVTIGSMRVFEFLRAINIARGARVIILFLSCPSASQRLAFTYRARASYVLMFMCIKYLPKARQECV